MIRARAAVAALSAFLALLAPGAALAQSTPSTRPSASLPTDAELRIKQAVLSSFRVLPVQNGIILVPIARRAGVDNVEVRDGTVAINGAVVTGAELRERLGRDGDVVLELSYLDLNTQRRLLLPARATPAPAAEEPRAQAPEQAPPDAEPETRAGDETAAAARREFRRVSNGRVRIGGPITVGEDEEVRGAVVAVGGSVEINGRVRDEVVAVGGSVRLGPRAEVYGDVTSVGGSLSRSPAAVVRGQVNEIEFAWPNIRIRPVGPWSVHIDPWWTGAPWRTAQFVGTLVRMGLFALLAALLLLLAPRPVERVSVAVRSEPWKSALVGFFAQLVFVPLLVVTIVFLVISIIGIPLLVLVPFLILAFFAALLLGFTGTASAVARGARERFTWAPTVPMLVVGLLVIWIFTLVGRLFSLPGGPFALVGGMLLLGGFLVEYAAWTVGLGGAILTRFGRVGRLYPPPLSPEVEAELGRTEPPPLS